jgi:hypothetical protein
MKLHTLLQTSLFAIALPLATSALADTVYTYTDSQDSTFSGSFSVASALDDGSYSFLLPDNQPSGFSESFFGTPFLDGENILRTPSLSLFNVTVANGAISLWDIRATTLFTMVRHTGSGGTGNVYYRNSTLIFHATNVPYLPGGGLAYQATITAGDYKTYYTYGMAYQEAITGAYQPAGAWSMSTSTPAVPEPASLALLLAGLGALAFVKPRR